ncbi:MAG: diaminopimelate decarboxylase [candidate division Zixibacteria bacterium]|nr:diaminopimelate decarboxylase [candidate division Zixibacteria bacterium]
MDYFTRKSGKLFCESVSLTRLAERYGTPLYVYSLRTFVRHYKIASRAFGDIPHSIFFSAKANSNLTLLKVIADLGGGCDVVSLGEYKAARKAGIKRVIFSGAGKRPDEIEAALKGGLEFFGVESENELELIEKIATRLGKTAPISLRLNPDVNPITHKYIATGLKTEKFGIPAGRAIKIYKYISQSDRLKPVGISMHLGSQIQTVKPFVEGFRKLKAIFRLLLEQRIVLSHIDLGGGWAAPFTKNQKLPGPSDYIKALVPQMKGLGVEFIVEPGRSLVGNAGVLVTKVIYLKTGYSRKFAIVDAGMNDLIRPALYDADHRIEPVLLRGGRSTKYDVVGPICESSDTFSKKTALSALHQGDLLCLFTVGAYGQSMASNYNSRLRSAEVLVRGNRDYLIRERENYTDLWRKQKLIDLKNLQKIKP